MAQFVEILVVSSCELSIGAGRDDRFHPGVSDTFDYDIGIVAAIGLECVDLQARDEGQSLRAICDCTRSDSDSERKTK